MKYFDAFSGYGGFSLGIQKAYGNNLSSRDGATEERNDETDASITGVETAETDSQRPGDTSSHQQFGNIGEVSCIGFSEIDKYAIQVYSKHFNHTPYGDISKIDWSTVPDFDLLTGGSPCQDFSIAGKRAGIKGERSGLVWEYIRCLEEKKPRYFIWENVKGVMSSRGGFDFANILTAFSEAGYDLQWQVLNAKDFGVPQNRERIFIIGSRGEPRPEVFPLGSGDRQDIVQFNNPTHSNNRLYGEDGISPALNTAQGGNRQPKIPVLTPDRLEKRQNGRRMKEDGDPSFTLTAQDRHGIYDGMKIRRLTPTECERLMGLPDGWTEYGVEVSGESNHVNPSCKDSTRCKPHGETGIVEYEEVKLSDTQRYKLCGNGVVVNVVEEIMKRLAK